MGWVRRARQRSLAAAVTLGIAAAFALTTATTANAIPMPIEPACAGNGTARADISFATNWYNSITNPSTGVTIYTQGWATPNDAQVSMVLSTDQAQTAIVNSVPATSTVSTGAGMLRAETTAAAGLSASTTYYVSMTVTDGSGATVACTPVYTMPAGNGLPDPTSPALADQAPWIGAYNPYTPTNGGFNRAPLAPTLDTATQSGANLVVGVTVPSSDLWSSVQYSTDGGATWASPTVTGASAPSIVPVSFNTKRNTTRIVPAMTVHTVAGPLHQSPAPINRTITVSIAQQSSGAAFGNGAYSVLLRGVNQTPNGGGTLYGAASNSFGFSYVPVNSGLAATGSSASPALPIALVASLAGIAALGTTVVIRRRQAR